MLDAPDEFHQTILSKGKEEEEDEREGAGSPEVDGYDAD